MSAFSLRQIAHDLNGEVVSGQVLAPGPGHSPRDRSLSVRISPTAPDGFVAFSHCGDDWRDCRDHVRRVLGLPDDAWKREREHAPRRPIAGAGRPPTPNRLDDDDDTRMAEAIALWRSSVDPRGTVVERYLASRGLDLGDDIAGEVIRWNAGVGAMIALFRNISTNRPHAISRTFFDANARKIARRFLGPVGGCAIKLDANAEVLTGLHIGEGLETCIAARQLGLRPCWALGSAGAVAAFPILSGIEALTVIVDHDESGAGEKAARAVEARWLAAGKEANLLRSDAPGDFNDLLKGAAA